MGPSAGHAPDRTTWPYQMGDSCLSSEMKVDRNLVSRICGSTEGCSARIVDSQILLARTAVHVYVHDHVHVNVRGIGWLHQMLIILESLDTMRSRRSAPFFRVSAPASLTNQFVSIETLPSEILRALRALAVKRHLENSKRSKNLKKDMSTYH